MSTTDDQGFDYDGALFDLDVPEPEPKQKLSRTAMAHRKVSNRIGAGVHPLGSPIRLHPDAPRDQNHDEARRSTSTGPRCGGCRFRVLVEGNSKSYPKCHLPTVIGGNTRYPRATGCESSDIAAWWPACTSWEQR